MDRKRFFFLVSLFDQSYWIIGSVLGALVGSLLTFDTTGIDFAMTALFVVVFTEQWRSCRSHLSALIGVGASLACLLVFGPDSFIIPAMAVITVLLTVFKKRLEGSE